MLGADPPCGLPCLFITMFRMPAAPSASYFAPGFVTTSILFTALAGMLLNTIEGFEENITLGMPSTYTLNEEEPFTEILS